MSSEDDDAQLMRQLAEQLKSENGSVEDLMEQLLPLMSKVLTREQRDFFVTEFWGSVCSISNPKAKAHDKPIYSALNAEGVSVIDNVVIPNHWEAVDYGNRVVVSPGNMRFGQREVEVGEDKVIREIKPEGTLVKQQIDGTEWLINFLIQIRKWDEFNLDELASTPERMKLAAALALAKYQKKFSNYQPKPEQVAEANAKKARLEHLPKLQK